MIMNKTTVIFFLLCFLPASLKADVPWQTNPLSDKKKKAAVEEKIAQIPLYEEKIEGDYDMLGPVRGQDILSRSQTAIFSQIRHQAYKIGADAVIDIQCKPILKSIFQSCEGIAIKFKNEGVSPVAQP